jgi:transketolase
MSYEDVLKELVATDDSIVVLTAENRSAIRGLPAVLGNAFIDVGICEQTMIGCAAGLALRGRTPICHALSTFLTLRAFEFIRTDVGIGQLQVKLVGAVPGFLSEGNGPTHQAIEDIAILRGIPGMHIFCPSDEADLVAGMPAIVKSCAPSYVRYNALPTPPSRPTHAPFEIGKAEVLFPPGEDVTILTYGFLVREALVARSILEASGRSAGLIHVRMPKPIDEAAILEAARTSRRLVTIEDHFLIGGLYTIVGEIFLRNRLATPPPVLAIALEGWFKPGLLAEVLAHEGFTGQQLADRIQGGL